MALGHKVVILGFIFSVIYSGAFFDSTIIKGTHFIKRIFEQYGGGGVIPVRSLDSLMNNIKNGKGRCISSTQLINQYQIDTNVGIDESKFKEICPGIVGQMDTSECPFDPVPAAYSGQQQASVDASAQKAGNETAKTIFDIKPRVWIASIISIVIISLVGLAGVAVVPLVAKAFYNQVIQFLVALAVGTLTGDAMLHLLPHAIVASVLKGEEGHGEERATIFKGLCALAGVYFFFIAERMVALISEYKSEKKANEEEERRLAAHPKKSVAEGPPMAQRRISATPQPRKTSMTYLAPECKETGFARRMSQALIDYGGDSISTGLSSKALKNIDHLIRQAESDDEDNDAEVTTNPTESTRLVVPGSKPVHEEENNDHAGADMEKNAGEGKDEFISLVVPQKKTASPQTDRKHSHASSVEDGKGGAAAGAVEKKGHGHGHGHGHEVPESVAAVAWMVIMGDGLHNFSDGLAIGAAFAQGIGGGLSTAVAVFCHELPHELGDFAVLLKTGMKVKQALFYNMLSSVLCFVGMLIGIAIGNVEEASFWIFAIAGGMFMYIALVDMLPELSTANVKPGESRLAQFFLQCAGICTGVGIMLLIALYEEDIKEKLDFKPSK